MNLKKGTSLLGITLAIFLIGLGGGVLLPVSAAQADLPSRSTPTPAPSQDDDEDDQDSGPIGAHIELHAVNAPVGAWSVVQWQNERGDWHDVAGWRGLLDANGYRRWWVAAKDFGVGPFRWVVYPSPGHTMIGVSEPFNLPAEANRTTHVEVGVR